MVLNRCLWCVVAVLAGARPALADEKETVVLVYDRAINDIGCWYTGGLRTDVDCSKQGVHPAVDDFWVYEDQPVYIQIIHSTFADDYSVEVKAEAQPEPSEHVFGALTEVPKISLFDTSVTTVPGAAAVAAAGKDPTIELIKQLPSFDDKQLAAALADLQSLDQDKTTKLVAVDLGFAVPHLRTSLAALTADAGTIQSDSTLVKARQETPDQPAFQDRVNATMKLIDDELKLRADADARDVTKEMRQVLDAYALTQDAVIQRALNVDPDQVAQLAADLAHVTPALSSKDFLGASPNANNLFPYVMPIVTKINAATKKPVPFTAKQAERLAANLQALAQARPSLLNLARDLRFLQKPSWGQGSNLQKELEAVIGKGAALRDATEKLTLDLVAIAQSVNAAMRTPLTGAKARLYLGRWDGNQVVTVTLKRAGRAPRFSYSGVRSAGAKVFSDAAEVKDASTAPDAAVTAVQATLHVRALYRFQLTTGIVVSSMSRADYSLVENEVDDNGTKTTQRFFLQDHDDGLRYFPSLNLVWYPNKRDLQKFEPRYLGDKAPCPIGFGLMAGLNLADPTRDALFGISITHRSGLGIAFGADVGYEHRLPNGVDVGVPITNAVVVKDHLTTAGFVSITVSSQFLKDFVGLVFK